MGKKKTTQKSGAGSGVMVLAVNKKARRDYEVLEVIETGISLQGAEVKSIRNGGVNLKESYVRLKGGEAFLLGCHISPYSHSFDPKYDPTRERKLLLHRRELDKYAIQVQQKGLSLIPLRFYLKGGKVKLEIALGRGKKLYDKREDVKAKEAQRDMERAFRHS